MFRTLLFTALFAASSALCAGTVTTLGNTLSYQGVLTDSGTAVTGTYVVDVCLYDSAVGGNLAGCQEATGVSVSDGLLNLSLEFPSGTFDGTQFFAEISIASAAGGAFTTLAPRQPIVAVPEAAHAQYTDYAQSAGSVRWTDITNMPAGFADGVDDVGTGGGGSGTVTSISAGAGLTGGIITTTGTLAVDFAQVQPLIVGTCNVGYYFRGTDGSGNALCEPLPTTTSTTNLLSFGAPASLAMAVGSDGKPNLAVQFYKAGKTETRVLRCADSRCSSLDSNALVSQVTPTGATFSQLAIAVGSDGFPMVAYQDTATYNLKLTRCTSANCSSNVTVTIDTPTGSNKLAERLSLHVPTSGRPLIAYSSTGASGQIRLARCANAACSGVTPNVVLVSGIGSMSGDGVYLRSDGSGNPTVVYQDNTAQELRLLLCTDASCSTVPTPITVEATVSQSFAAYAFRNPGLTYVRRPATGTALRSGHCATTCISGASLGSIAPPTGASIDWLDSRMVVPADNIPLIVSNEQTDSGLWLTRCYDSNCLGGADVHLVAGDARQTSDFALAVGSDQLPLIAYQDSSNNLRFLRCATRTCR